jgi:hypothetical protein
VLCVKRCENGELKTIAAKMAYGSLIKDVGTSGYKSANVPLSVVMFLADLKKSAIHGASGCLPSKLKALQRDAVFKMTTTCIENEK